MLGTANHRSHVGQILVPWHRNVTVSPSGTSKTTSLLVPAVIACIHKSARA